ncbi:serine/threonine-protein kinase [Nonomuraea spiralis]|uniref:serine/threonine-protein kinase n=1 Tax=Nonomuraea spiralis TaxID=46182 RepID=UPI003787A08D
MQKKIGQGGMAELFAARDEHLDRKVAVKFQLPRAFESTVGFGEMGDGIEDEYFRLGKIPEIRGIPSVLDVGRLGKGCGRRFFVMEFVDGITMKEWLVAHQPVQSVAAVCVIAQLCEILADLHAGGYVHRDVTPSNVMMQARGQLSLLDVGISLPIGETNFSPCGSPGYAAPEQYDQTARLDQQTDVFPLGAMLFEMMIAELPYAGLDLPLDRTARPFPPDFRPEMPENLRALGLAMVSIDPRDRPDGPKEVLSILRPMLPPLSAPAAPKATRPDPTAYYRQGLSAS